MNELMMREMEEVKMVYVYANLFFDELWFISWANYSFAKMKNDSKLFFAKKDFLKIECQNILLMQDVKSFKNSTGKKESLTFLVIYLFI